VRGEIVIRRKSEPFVRLKKRKKSIISRRKGRLGNWDESGETRLKLAGESKDGGVGRPGGGLSPVGGLFTRQKGDTQGSGRKGMPSKKKVNNLENGGGGQERLFVIRAFAKVKAFIGVEGVTCAKRRDRENKRGSRSAEVKIRVSHWRREEGPLKLKEKMLSGITYREDISSHSGEWRKTILKVVKTAGPALRGEKKVRQKKREEFPE